jgi:hypothetical protein
VGAWGKKPAANRGMGVDDAQKLVQRLKQWVVDPNPFSRSLLLRGQPNQFLPGGAAIRPGATR